MLVVCPKILLSKSVNYFLVNMKDADKLIFLYHLEGGHRLIEQITVLLQNNNL